MSSGNFLWEQNESPIPEFLSKRDMFSDFEFGFVAPGQCCNEDSLSPNYLISKINDSAKWFTPGNGKQLGEEDSQFTYNLDQIKFYGHTPVLRWQWTVEFYGGKLYFWNLIVEILWLFNLKVATKSWIQNQTTPHLPLYNRSFEEPSQ